MANIKKKTMTDASVASLSSLVLAHWIVHDNMHKCLRSKSHHYHHESNHDIARPERFNVLSPPTQVQQVLFENWKGSDGPFLLDVQPQVGVDPR